MKSYTFLSTLFTLSLPHLTIAAGTNTTAPDVTLTGLLQAPSTVPVVSAVSASPSSRLRTTFNADGSHWIAVGAPYDARIHSQEFADSTPGNDTPWQAWSVPHQAFVQNYMRSERRRAWFFQALRDDMARPSVPTLYEVLYPARARPANSAALPFLPSEVMHNIANRLSIAVRHIVSPQLLYRVLSASGWERLWLEQIAQAMSSNPDLAVIMRRTLNSVANAYGGDARLLDLREQALLSAIRSLGNSSDFTLYNHRRQRSTSHLFNFFRDSCRRQDVPWLDALNNATFKDASFFRLVPRLFDWGTVTFEEAINLFSLLESTQELTYDAIWSIIGLREHTQMEFLRGHIQHIEEDFLWLERFTIAELGLRLGNRHNFAATQQSEVFRPIPWLPDVDESLAASNATS